MPIAKSATASAGKAPLQGTLAVAAIALAAFHIPSTTATTPRAGLMAASARAAPAPSFAPATPLPTPEPLVLRPVAPETAAAINAAIPVAALPNPAARGYVVRALTPIDQMRSQDCLAQAVYYEARSEGEAGQRAVAQVVLNRLRHPAYPASVCGVVYQGSQRSTGCQFTFTCDGSLGQAPRGPGWDRARRIAAEALAGKVYAPVGHATHYHTHQVLPYWASSLLKSAVVGAHIFYRWTGGWGQPAAFRQRYSGVEPLPAPLPALPDSDALLAAQIAAAGKSAAEAAAAAATAPADDTLPKVRYTALGLPESRVRERYRNSGAWRVDPASAPAQPSAD
jgi:spore germination cell wall hydrolase CwlJ-like protein